jgi:hypothetical protein
VDLRALLSWLKFPMMTMRQKLTVMRPLSRMVVDPLPAVHMHAMRWQQLTR